jgi:hypothetical protein
MSQPQPERAQPNAANAINADLQEQIKVLVVRSTKHAIERDAQGSLLKNCQQDLKAALAEVEDLKNKLAAAAGAAGQ